MTKSERAAELRRQAEELEKQEHLAERLKDADTIPTCPHCGSRVFTVGSWTTVAQSISYEDDEDDGDWGDDYQSGDHTDESAYATCAECHADAQEVLEKHGWTFYDDPKPEGSTTISAIDAKHLRSAATRLTEGALSAEAALDMGKMIALLLDHAEKGDET